MKNAKIQFVTGENQYLDRWADARAPKGEVYAVVRMTYGADVFYAVIGNESFMAVTVNGVKMVAWSLYELAKLAKKVDANEKVA